MLTLIIPFRDWPGERVAACADSFARLGTDILSEILVVDFGSTSRTEIALPDDARVRQVRLEASVWSSSEATNAGVLLAQNELVAKTDADFLLDPATVPACEAEARRIGRGEGGVLLTQAIDLPPHLSLAAARDLLAAGATPEGTLRPKWGQGGLTLFRRADWAAIGGFDSRFTGWGNEDNDFAERFRQSGRPIEWIARDRVRIYHVAHPPTHASAHVARQRARNQALAASDRSVLRQLAFRHSDAESLLAPNLLRREHPHVTVAIATSGRPGRDRMIGEAIGSFRGQIDNDFEVVVVDNGSDDEAHDSLRAALQALEGLPSLRLERAAQPSIPAARNLITSLARGRYVCVADDDDIALPNRLADHLANFVADGSIHGSHGGWIDFDEDTGQIERNTGKARSLAVLLKGRGKVTAHPASFYRADALRALSYDESLDLGSDLDLAIRMAAMGMRIPHTGSFVVLRRFHAANVTVTGQASQAANGRHARRRLDTALNPQLHETLAELALASDDELACRNHQSLDQLAEMLPDYAGEWRLALRVDQLGAAGEGDIGAAQLQALESLLALTDGDLLTLEGGTNQPVAFCSQPVKGLRAARQLAQAMTAVAGHRPRLIADAQWRADREQRFDWRAFVGGGPGCVLRSPRFTDLAEALGVLGGVTPGSLLHKLTTLVSDCDAAGPCYFVATTPIGSGSEVESLRLALLEKTGLDFSPVGPDGRPGNPLPVGDRHH